MSPLEGWPRGSGAGKKSAPGPQGHLGVGADVQADDRFLGPVDARREKHGHVVGAHKASDIGQQVHVPTGGDLQSHVPRFEVQGINDSRQVGG